MQYLTTLFLQWPGREADGSAQNTLSINSIWQISLSNNNLYLLLKHLHLIWSIRYLYFGVPSKLKYQGFVLLIKQRLLYRLTFILQIVVLSLLTANRLRYRNCNNCITKCLNPFSPFNVSLFLKELVKNDFEEINLHINHKSIQQMDVNK